MAPEVRTRPHERHHRHDRRAYVLAVLGRDPDGNPLNNSATGPPAAPDPSRVAWEKAKNTDNDVAPLPRRLLRGIAHATRWRAEYRAARDALAPPGAPAAVSDSTDNAA